MLTLLNHYRPDKHWQTVTPPLRTPVSLHNGHHHHSSSSPMGHKASVRALHCIWSSSACCTSPTTTNQSTASPMLHPLNNITNVAFIGGCAVLALQHLICELLRVRSAVLHVTQNSWAENYWTNQKVSPRPVSSSCVSSMFLCSDTPDSHKLPLIWMTITLVSVAETYL